MTELVAGRELDALVAEKVMGLNLGCRHSQVSLIHEDSSLMRCDTCGEEFGQTTLAMDQARLKFYSTDIVAAWEVVTGVAKDRVQVYVEIQPTGTWPNEEEPCDPDRLWRCGMGLSGTDMLWVHEYATTAPLAICLAAIKLTGHTTETPSVSRVAGLAE